MFLRMDREYSGFLFIHLFSCNGLNDSLTKRRNLGLLVFVVSRSNSFAFPGLAVISFLKNICVNSLSFQFLLAAADMKKGEVLAKSSFPYSERIPNATPRPISFLL